MSPYRQIRLPKEPDDLLKKRRMTNSTRVPAMRTVDAHGSQRTLDNVNSMSPTGVLQLQQTVGNRAVERLLEKNSAEQATSGSQQSIQRSIEEEEELICPGSKIRSGGQGRGEGYGEGKGPIGNPKDEEWG
jgi:hypothetical protein